MGFKYDETSKSEYICCDKCENEDLLKASTRPLSFQELLTVGIEEGLLGSNSGKYKYTYINDGSYEITCLNC